MPNVEARLKVKGKEYCISVDVDEALKIRRKQGGDVARALNSDNIFHDLNKGLKASDDELKNAFGTANVYEIAEKIIKDGEVQKPQEYRDAERETRIKKVVDLILKNAVDQHGKPFTESRIRRAIDEIHYSFDSRPAEQQMRDVVHKMKEIIPIKIDTKKIKLIVPARFTGKVYSVLHDYKEKEEWLSNGDLQVIVNVPAGIQIDFYEKLNGITHGAIISEEIEES